MTDELGLDNPENVQTDPDEPVVNWEEKFKESEAKRQETDEKNKQLFERAKKAEDKIKTLPKEEPKNVNDDSWKNKINFLLSNSDKKYSEEEFDHIASIADRKKLSLSEAAKIEENYIQFNREKVAKEKKIPEPANVPGGLPKKEITVEDIEKDSDVHKKAFDKLFEQGQESGI